MIRAKSITWKCLGVATVAMCCFWGAAAEDMAKPSVKLRVTIADGAVKEGTAKYKLPAIRGMALAEVMQSGLVEEILSHGGRILLEDRDYRQKDVEPDGRRITRCSPDTFAPGDIIVIETCDLTIGN